MDCVSCFVSLFLLGGLARDASSAVYGLVLALRRLALDLHHDTQLVWIKHYANIQRLLKGEEPKVGKRKRISQNSIGAACPSEAERFAIVQLIQSTGIGPGRFFDLYHRFGTPPKPLKFLLTPRAA